MSRYRNPFLLALAGLLAACVSEQPAVPAPAPKTDAPPVTPATAAPSLRGQLLGVAPGADVELALLAIDLSGRPTALLGQAHLRGDGQPLRFQLPLDAVPPSQTQRVELRGRVSQAGRLVQRLPARTISNLQDQDLGTLSLVPAP
ncbi:YbaY family lipoprotein [Pseudomonas sp. SH1-B]